MRAGQTKTSVSCLIFKSKICYRRCIPRGERIVFERVSCDILKVRDPLRINSIKSACIEHLLCLFNPRRVMRLLHLVRQCWLAQQRRGVEQALIGCAKESHCRRHHPAFNEQNNTLA